MPERPSASTHRFSRHDLALSDLYGFAELASAIANASVRAGEREGSILADELRGLARLFRALA